jgi:hypothetical protein
LLNRGFFRNKEINKSFAENLAPMEMEILLQLKQFFVDKKKRPEEALFLTNKKKLKQKRFGMNSGMSF